MWDGRAALRWIFLLAAQGLAGITSNPVLSTAIAGLATSATAQATIEVDAIPAMCSVPHVHAQLQVSQRLKVHWLHAAHSAVGAPQQHRAALQRDGAAGVRTHLCIP